jgi:hypothetical protein
MESKIMIFGSIAITTNLTITKSFITYVRHRTDAKTLYSVSYLSTYIKMLLTAFLKVSQGQKLGNSQNHFSGGVSWVNIF